MAADVAVDEVEDIRARDVRGAALRTGGRGVGVGGSGGEGERGRMSRGGNKEREVRGGVGRETRRVRELEIATISFQL